MRTDQARTEEMTVVDALVRRATIRPDAIAFRFIARHDDPGTTLGWGQLHAEASDLAAALPEMADPGRTGVMICCADERRFVVSLVATWLRGAVAIPATGGLSRAHAERNGHIARSARPDVILQDLPDEQVARLAGLAPMATILSAANPARGATPSTPTPPRSGGILQFTSGSTGAAKGILVDHAAIALNCRAMQDAYALNHASIGTHWLPLHHDMGLIGSVVSPLWLGAQSVILRPSVFMQQPVQWLRAVSDHRATITSAPNFAFEHIADKVGPDDLGGIDLSCLQTVVIGGEPVREVTVRRLLALLEPHGLRPAAIAPSYGLAEAVLFVSSGQTTHGPRFAAADHGGQACLGQPVPTVTVEIRAEGGGASAEGEIGDLWISGPGCGRVIAAGADWRDPHPVQPIRTGDHGTLIDGALFVTGRDADRIILRGRNVFAEDVEACVRESQPPGTIGGLAAFGIDAEGTQHLCILVEIQRRDGTLDLPALNRALTARIGATADCLVPLHRLALPRTSSGKVRRRAAREAYLGGNLDGRRSRHEPA